MGEPMTNARSFVRFDLAALRPYAGTLACTCAVVILFGAVAGQDAHTIAVVCMAVSLFAPTYPFSLDERARLDTLYGVLPLRRAAVVTGRYLTMVLFTVVMTPLGLALASITAAITTQPVDAGQLRAQILLIVLLGAPVLIGSLMHMDLTFMRAL